MRVKFLSSKNKEVEKMTGIFLEYQWFIDHNFPIILPKFFKGLYQKFKNSKKLVIQKEIDRELTKIYDKNVYQKKIKIIKKQWQKIEKDFFDTLEGSGFKIRNNYFCHVSLYGPQGQYRYPNITDIRASKSVDIKQANIIIAHEIIHLIIHNKVEKLKLSYEQTEGVVDLFFKETKLKTLFPKYYLQDIGIHDRGLFKKFFKE